MKFSKLGVALFLLIASCSDKYLLPDPLPETLEIIEPNRVQFTIKLYADTTFEYLESIDSAYTSIQIKNISEKEQFEIEYNLSIYNNSNSDSRNTDDLLLVHHGYSSDTSGKIIGNGINYLLSRELVECTIYKFNDETHLLSGDYEGLYKLLKNGKVSESGISRVMIDYKGRISIQFDSFSSLPELKGILDADNFLISDNTSVLFRADSIYMDEQHLLTIPLIKSDSNSIDTVFFKLNEL